MVSGPRDYSAGTERALFRLAEGTCYYPGCEIPIITIEDGHPIVGVEIAHIRGANARSARYAPSMTDDERAAFDNLILLCVTHHKLVDRLERDKYTVGMLTRWKEENEPADGLATLRTLVTETNLEGLLEQIITRLGPIRRVEVDLVAGVVVSPVDVFTVPLAMLDSVLSNNSHLAGLQQVIVANVRNVGGADVSVEAVDFYFLLEEGELSLLGRNDFGASNPPLPHRVEGGAALRWFMKMETAQMVAEAEPLAMVGIQASIRLGSGEDVRSERVPWPWRNPAADDEPTQSNTGETPI